MKKLIALMAIAGASVCFADATEPPSNLYDLTTSDAGRVSDTSSQHRNYPGVRAFDGSVSGDGNRWLSGEASSWWIIYKFNVSTVVDSISIALPPEGVGVSSAARAPKIWTFEGSNDNSKWDILDTQTGQSGWSDGDKRYYKFETPNTKAYQYYKFNCTANNGDKKLQIGEFEFYCVGTGNSTWTGGGETGLVNDDGNWGGAAMPGSECVANINNTGDTPATIPAGPTFWKNLNVGVGSGNNAKVVQEMGTVAVAGDFYVGFTACGEYKMSGGRCTTGTSLSVGSEPGSQGLFEMTGGTLSATSSLIIGRFGHGTFSASGDGTVVTAADVRVGFTYNSDKKKGYGTFIVTNGAEVATTKIYAGAGKSHVDRAKVVFDGAVLTATAASAEFLKDLPDVTLGAGGLTINTEGNAVTIANCAFVAEPGAKITVTGGGTVTFADCTVAFTEKPGRSFAFAETDGVFSGMPAFSNIGGSTVVMSGDNKKISIVRHGLMIIFQ